MRTEIKYFALFSQISFVVVLSIILFLYVGIWLDKRLFGDSGIFTLLGLFLGLSSAGYNTYKIFNRFLHEVEKDEEKRNKKKA
jgi:positive regulator of sigma E activity